MTLSLALTLNAIADVALVGGLTWFMSRPTKLTPHISAAHGQQLALIQDQGEALAEQERIAA